MRLDFLIRRVFLLVIIVWAAASLNFLDAAALWR